MATESQMASNLAVDILADHFGDVVCRVGKVLVQRGALSVQDIMRFLSHESTLEEEPLRFPHVRNALLVLVQHNVVVAKPHPRAAQNEQLQSMLKVYHLSVEAVITRLRFPAFLEYCFWRYGDSACELMQAVLRHGRASARVAIEEVQQELRDTTPEELDKEFRRLLADGLLTRAEPYKKMQAPPPEASPEASPPPAEASPPPLADDAANGDAKRRRLESGEQATPASSSTALAPHEGKQLVASDAASKGSIADSGNIYYYNRKVLNLMMIKNLLCRMVEEKVSGHAGQVLAALFEACRPSVRGIGIDIEYMNFDQVDDNLRKLGGHTPGRDPARERDKLRKVLDLLAAHKDGLLKKRMMHSNCSTAGERAQASDVTEFALEWQAAKRMLVNNAITQMVRDQFGLSGLRIFNFLTEQTPPQRLDEQLICSTCMIPPGDGREILNEMCRRGIVNWQEVPKGATAPMIASFWLFYVDYTRLQKQLLWNVFQAALNLRVRFRLENTRVLPLESRKDSLTKKERLTLKEGRRIEDILERSFLVLDSAILVLTAV